jgi:predicted anti-sigma-YlaC factor YlaD
LWDNAFGRKELRQAFSLAIDRNARQALPGDTVADIREHFEGCDACSDLYLTLRAADRFYSAAAGREVPATYREALRERMEERVKDARES